MAQERRKLGEPGGEIVLDISPTADRQEWDRVMDLVEQAMKDNKDASGVTLFRWNSKDRFGRQIAASISGNISGTFPHDVVLFDADFGWGLDRSPQRLWLFRDSTKVIDGPNQLYVGNAYQITQFFSVACRALEHGILPDEIRMSASTAYEDELFKFPEDNSERLNLAEKLRVKFSGELSRRQFL